MIEYIIYFKMVFHLLKTATQILRYRCFIVGYPQAVVSIIRRKVKVVFCNFSLDAMSSPIDDTGQTVTWPTNMYLSIINYFVEFDNTVVPGRPTISMS